MDSEEKQKVQDALAKGVEAGKQAAAATEGKPMTWWARLIIILGAAALGAASVWLTSCESAQQAGGVIHGLYHLQHPDRPCLLDTLQEQEVEDCGK